MTAGGGGACARQLLTRKMSVHSLRMRSTQGSSSNMMEWLIPLKNSLTNFPITNTTEAYRPMMLRRRRTQEEGEVSPEHVTTGSVAKVACTRIQPGSPDWED